MTSNQFIKGLVLAAILGYLFTLDSAEARGWPDEQQQQQQQQQDAILRQQFNDIQAQYGNIQNALANGMQPGGDESPNLDRLDSDEDDEEDDRVEQQQQQLQPASLPIQQLGSQLYQTGQQYPGMGGQQQPSSEDLRTAASKHYGHHKHGAKGWLDMGAWTGKKGAFGWYDKHPVGKGK